MTTEIDAEGLAAKHYVKRHAPGHWDSGGEVVVSFSTDDEMAEIIRRLATTRTSEAEPVAMQECTVCRGYCIDNQGRDCRACNGQGVVALPTPASDDQVEAVREAAEEVLSADDEFRRSMAPSVERDPLTRACDKLRQALAAMGSTKP